MSIKLRLRILQYKVLKKLFTKPLMYILEDEIRDIATDYVDNGIMIDDESITFVSSDCRSAVEFKL